MTPRVARPELTQLCSAGDYAVSRVARRAEASAIVIWSASFRRERVAP
jgi:hypothetical protein